MNYSNRRKFHRIDFDGMVNVHFVDSTYECCPVKNISLTGMCILGHFRQHQTEECLVRLFHKEKSGNNCLRACGKIVWNSDEGAGLQFTTMSFEDYMLLQTTLISKAEHPEIILRELPKNCPFELSGWQTSSILLPQLDETYEELQ